MHRKHRPCILAVPLASIASLVALNASFAADGRAASGKPASKKMAEKMQAQAASAAAASSAGQSSGDSNVGTQIVRMGLTVDLVNQAGIASVTQFFKVVQTQLKEDGLGSVTQTLKAANRSEKGATFIVEIADVVSSGIAPNRLSKITRAVGRDDFNVDDATNLMVVVQTVGRGTADSLLLQLSAGLSSGDDSASKSLVKQISAQIKASPADLSGLKVLISDIAEKRITLGEADKRLASGGSASGGGSGSKGGAAASGDMSLAVSPVEMLRKRLDAASRVIYDGLTDGQKMSFALLFSNSKSEEVSEILKNADLMVRFPALLDEAVQFFALHPKEGGMLNNPLLQEAAKVGNDILRNRTWNTSLSLSSGLAYTYDRLFPNGYNEALVSLIARYSNTDKFTNAIDDFVWGKTINNKTLLNSIYTEDEKNTDLLGLRRLNSYFTDSPMRLNYALGQGEAVFGRNISIGGSAPIQLDLSGTNLNDAGYDRASARLFAVTAFQDMSLSGGITLKNSQADNGAKHTVVSLGAMNILTIADNTSIANESRILVLGGAKVKGSDGSTVKGLSLSSQNSILLGSGADLQLENSLFQIRQSSAYTTLAMYAQNLLSVSNSTFSGLNSGSLIYMEAITLNLRNIDFPDGVDVSLVSRDGGTFDGVSGSGIYPHFGSSAAGRVNFISGVKYGGHPINSTSDFDDYGYNISISRLQQGFVSSLDQSGKAAFAGLTPSQQSKFQDLADSGFNFVPPQPQIQFPASTVLANSRLMEGLSQVLDNKFKFGLDNYLLQEAARVGNAIIADRAYGGAMTLLSSDAYTYDKLFSNGYNRALVLLMAGYSNNARFVDSINTFEGSRYINEYQPVYYVFSNDGPNTDLIGLRRVSLFNPSFKTLPYMMSQGETFFSRSFSIGNSAASDTILDVTQTKLADAKVNDRDTFSLTKTAGLVTVAALGDASISGKVTVKNFNADAAKTRNVIAIGAVGSLKVADGTKIINEGRVLAVGAGKLQGANGTAITGLELESKGAIVVGSGKDLHLVNAKFKVTNDKANIAMYAQDTMTVTNPTFTFNGKSSIYMEATTVNLTNVNFPDQSKVKLVSRDGGTANGVDGSGIYPKFGSSVPGRVNFISNVSYNSNPIGNKSQFDANGSNITISKFPTR